MQKIIVDTIPGFRMPSIFFSQGDVGTQFAIDLRSRFGDALPASPTITIQATKPSGFGFSVSATSFTNGVATFTTTSEMTDEAGRFPAELKVVKDSVTLYTANFYMDGEATTHPEGTIDGSAEVVIPELTQLVERVEDAASSVLDMTVEAETLAAGSQATYSYDEDTNTATFGIPQGEAGAGAAGVTANAYSSSATYAVGDYVIHNSNLYRCTTAITTAEAFTAAHWTQVVLGDDVSDLKSDVNMAENVLEMPSTSRGRANPYGMDNWVTVLAHITLESGKTYQFELTPDRTYTGSVAILVATSGSGTPASTTLFNGSLSTHFLYSYTANQDYTDVQIQIYGAQSDTVVTATVVEADTVNAIERIDTSINNINNVLADSLCVDKNEIVSETLINTHGGTYVDTPNNTISVMSAYAWDSLIVPCNGGESFCITGKGGSGDARLFGFLPEISSSTTPLIKVASAEQSSTGLNNEIVVAPIDAKWAIFNLKHEDYATNKIAVSTGILNDVSKRTATIENTQNHVRFMVFGNSYGMDSITYVPFILKNLGITSEIYLYRRDACTLRDIYNRWTSNSETDTETDGIHAGTYMRAVYHIDTRYDSSWKSINRISMKDCVELGNWDFITLQQWSAYSIDPTTYSPWLPLVIDLIRQSVDKSTMLAWTQVCTRATHDDKQASLNVFKEVPFDKFPFDFYIPYGTAIFNARANQMLATLGDYSDHNLWKDGVHLQDGLPRYIAALTVCESICRKFFPKISVMFDKTRPTSENVTAWVNYMPMTPVVGVTEANCLMAQYSAINACNHMFTITPTESLPTPPSE